MGDRYELIEDCIYCGKTNKKIRYAPTSNVLTFECDKCKKENFITTDLKVKKMEDVTYDDVYWAINNASNMMDEKSIKSMAKDVFKKLSK